MAQKVLDHLSLRSSTVDDVVMNFGATFLSLSHFTAADDCMIIVGEC